MTHLSHHSALARLSSLLVALLSVVTASAVSGEEKDYAAYLFVYFTGNKISEEAIRFAVSTDGYDFKALNGNNPVLDSRVISSTGGVRDPHILRCEDGKTFYMVATDMVSANGWSSNRAMVLLKSTDLVHWSHAVVNMQKRYPGQEQLKRVWAPQTIYDREAGRYMIYWSMQYGSDPDVIYYAYANDDFTDLVGEPKPLFLPADRKSCIDGDIVYKDGVYHLFYKTEGHGNGIKVATTRSLTSGQWTESPDYKQQTKDAVEGAGTFKLIGSDKYILMYDVYMKGRYQFTETSDFEHFKVIDQDVKMDFHPRHGTVIPITAAELRRLTDQWGTPEGLSVVGQNAVTPAHTGSKSHDSQRTGYPITPVPFTATHVSGGFWKRRLDACRDVTVPLAFSKCEEEGRYDNFVKAAHPSDTIQIGGFPFDDTDVYKTIEGASYLLQTYPDKRMERYIDSVVAIVAGAQELDGYLYTARTMNPKRPHPWAGAHRWDAVEAGSHELYDLGHMIEGAVAYYQATGKRAFLDVARRYADNVCRTIGPGKDQIVRVPGHQIAEMALARLYLATGERKYLDEAKFFLDERGHTSRKDAYSQAHKPVVEQDEAVGHAVRATYMYSGMADVAALTGDTAYVNAIGRIWDNIVGKKLYLTGGIGSRASNEGFGENYELPNATAYCETCAAIGNVYVNHRLFLFHGDAKYYDVLERSLYNGVLSGISLDGGKFFYPNPLESAGGYERKPWFGCACCPSNLCRFLPSVPGYVYATRGDSLYVNLFMEGSSDLRVGKAKVTLRQATAYPFEGVTTLTIAKGGGDFALKLRVPGWSRGEVTPGDLYRFADGRQASYVVKVNGREVKGALDKGYFTVSRRWKKGDVVELSLDMTPRLVEANGKVEADRGMLAVERGPLVYCAEWPDNKAADLFSVLLPRHARLAMMDDKAPGGASMIEAGAQVVAYDASGRLTAKDFALKLIPYYAWANRGQGKMMVWLPSEAGAMHIGPAMTMDTNEFLDK